MKVTYLNKIADSSRVGMIVPLCEVRDRELFVFTTHEWLTEGTKQWRNGNRMEIYGRNNQWGDDLEGFFSPPCNFKYPVEILQENYYIEKGHYQHVSNHP